MNGLISILGILLTIFLVIGFHELGHFLVARFFNIKVLRFSIGFGKRLFHWYDKKGTEYVFAAIPLGGYIKMVDENEEHVSPADLPYAFNRQPLFKRMAVILAGPFANLILALILYWLLFVIGFTSIKPIIGTVAPHSIAAQAGIQPHQEIIQIDGKNTTTWYAVILKVFARAGDTTTMTIETFSKNHPLQIHTLQLADWHLDDLKPDPIASLGIEPFEPYIPAIIAAIAPDSPAAQSDLRKGDKIISVENKSIKDWIALVTLVAQSPDETLTFKVERKNKILTFPIKIGSQRDLFFKKHGFLGVMPDFVMPSDLLRFQQEGPLAAIPKAFEEVKNFVTMNFILLEKIITGKVSLKSLGGPITIFESAGTAINHGFIAFLSFLAFLSISIGIINILPIPGLDGGHFLFEVVELIRGKPLSDRAQLLLYRLGLVFLLLLIIQALTNDILRL